MVLDDQQATDYQIVSGPSWLTFDSSNNLSLQIPAGVSAGQSQSFEIKATNSSTGKGRILKGSVYVIDGTVIASGSVDVAGGQIKNAEGDLVITVPADPTRQPVNITVLQGRDGNNKVLLQFRADGYVGNVQIQLPLSPMLKVKLLQSKS